MLPHHTQPCVGLFWFVDRLEQDESIIMRFVIGQTTEAAKEAEIVSESRQYGGFMRIPLQVCI